LAANKKKKNIWEVLARSGILIGWQKKKKKGKGGEASENPTSQNTQQLLETRESLLDTFTRALLSK
jgi:hypothetical protein